MEDEFVRQYKKEELYIIELSSASIGLIAQALHLHEKCFNRTELSSSTINALVLQTIGTYDDPIFHNVFENTIQAPKKAICSKLVYSIPVK